MLAVYEAEARATDSYERLVRYLIAQKQFDDAERWAREGIEKTREKLPGVASSLAASLCEVSRGRKQWDIVAAHAAWRFFEHPGRTTFDELIAHAAKAKCGEHMRAAALQYVRKISGTTKPPKVNQAAFDRAVEDVAAATQGLLEALVATSPPHDRAVERQRARIRRERQLASALAGMVKYRWRRISIPFSGWPARR